MAFWWNDFYKLKLIARSCWNFTYLWRLVGWLSRILMYDMGGMSVVFMTFHSFERQPSRRQQNDCNVSQSSQIWKRYKLWSEKLKQRRKKKARSYWKTPPREKKIQCRALRREISKTWENPSHKSSCIANYLQGRQTFVEFRGTKSKYRKIWNK